MYFWNLFLQLENGESMQILHYENGQKYEPHFDYFHDKANQELGGHRVATVLMYLSNVEKGGETIFPNSEVINFLRLTDSVVFISLILMSFLLSPVQHQCSLVLLTVENVSTNG